jgi:hypothetical protein
MEGVDDHSIQAIDSAISLQGSARALYATNLELS